MARLEDIKKIETFPVPDGYFDQLEKEVLQHVKAERVRQKRRSLLLYAFSGVAAALLLLFATTTVVKLLRHDSPAVVQTTPEQENPVLTAQLTTQPDTDPAKTLLTYHPSPANEIEHDPTQLDNVDYQIIEYYNDEILYDETF
ncbi:MAG: hypothetical protein LBR51_08095 [Bacteroidales bacterium]|jgi:hypothetical protein|nr:hypothetical protein [Bacteroidales bacterium]